MKAIFKRELSSYFNSPLIYIILSVFLVISTLFFMMYNMLGASPDLYSVFYSMNTILLFLVPMITMRLFSE
jgi:ABC-2 type transport system permease protein